MRHGVALERQDWAEHDATRPLSKECTDKTRRAVRGLKRLCPRVDLIASSPYLRAAQTAQIVRQELRAEREVQAWFELALMLEEDADLAPLVARLREAAQFEWKKAGVACLELEVESEHAILHWLASPKMLRGLAQTAGR